MNATQLLKDLKSQGIEVRLSGTNLRMTGRGKKLDQATRERLRQGKAEIIALLAKQDAADDVERLERAAIAQYSGGIPEEWCDGFAILQTMPRPDQFDYQEWQTLINDAGLFLDRWAMQATELGWQTHEIFGLFINGNRRRLDCMGLIPLLKGRPVVGLTDSFVEYRTATGAILCFYKGERAPLCEIKSVWH